jgi:uncharacterized GH25 family protein
MGSNMTKRFKIEPDFTCPELAGYKLPPIERRQEDDVEAMAKEEFNNIDNPIRSGIDNHSYKTGFTEGYTKAREKYEFSREDLVHAIDLAQEVHKPKYCHHYEHTYTPEQIMSILLTPIAIEVEMVQKSINGSIPVGQDWECVPATNPDGTLKGRYIYE